LQLISTQGATVEHGVEKAPDAERHAHNHRYNRNTLDRALGVIVRRHAAERDGADQNNESWYAGW
jgi:hypothetical protein